MAVQYGKHGRDTEKTTRQDLYDAYIKNKAKLDAEQDAITIPRNRRLTPEADDAVAGIGRFDDPNLWMKTVVTHISEAMFYWGDLMGYGEDYIKGQLQEYLSPMLLAVEKTLLRPADILFAKEYTRDTDGPESVGRAYYTANQRGIDIMVRYAMNWFGREVGIPLREAPSQGSGRRGASGPRGLTAEEIRNKFDIKELTNVVNDTNRMLVLEDHTDPKKVARDYVESIVATKGETKIDFDTFVRERIMATARFKIIYRNKPEALTPEQYMAPYFGAAMAVAEPDEATDIAVQGAIGMASQDAFAARLRRTDAVTGSSGFIGELQGRMERLGSVLAGS